MSSDTVVRNQHPQTNPGVVRLAVVAEAPAVEECSWCVCASGHGFGLEHWQNRQIVQRDRCPLCGSQNFTPKPTPMVGESGRLLDTLLKEAGLPRDRCWIGNCSQRPLSEHEKTLEHCRGGLARLAVDLENFRPHCVLLLGNLALSAFLGLGHSVTNWRGSVTMGQLAGQSYKVCIACHPAAILREPAQTCLLRMDIKRAVEEAASPSLNLPERFVWMARPDGLRKECVR